MLLEHMHKKFEINWTKIKGGCQSRRKVITHNSKSEWFASRFQDFLCVRGKSRSKFYMPIASLKNRYVSKASIYI